MRHLRTRAASAVIASLLVLAGCGSSDGGAASNTTTTKADAATTTTATGTSTTAAAGTPSADDATPAIVAATDAFLETLTADEKDAVQFDFDDTEQRQKWSNLPEGLYERDGLMWGNLDEDSQQAWLGVLKSILSDEGYEQVYGEWHADDALAATDSGGGGGPGNLTYGEDYYWVAIIGEPSETEAWQFQFGGHHVTVNATIKGADVSVTPSFIGVQPAVYDSDGNEIKPLGTIESDAYAVVNSLEDDQQSDAVLGDTLIDLVLGPGEDGKTIESQGIKGSDLTDEQQDLLLSLISHYGNLVDEEDAAARMEQLTSEIDDTYFAWYGPTDAGDTSGIYFRVTGPSVVIEYSGQDMGGDATDHIHGIYRDPTNDYGSAFGAGLS
ncbi:MAG: hypothetical protein JWO77_477 [Ilumatobacteraceae bacterium]|nr:hypothetical protein [Ilumatobacteraceae bacterium]